MFVLLSSLDPNLVALIVFALTLLFIFASLVMVYYMTIVKNPKLLSDFLSLIGKLLDAIVTFFKRTL